MSKKITPDKWKHFFVGIAMGVVLSAAAYWFLPVRPWVSAMLVFTVIVSVCYGFELFSKFTGWGYYELMDAVAGVAGGLIGMIVTALIIWWTGK